MSKPGHVRGWLLVRLVSYRHHLLFKMIEASYHGDGYLKQRTLKAAAPIGPLELFENELFIFTIRGVLGNSYWGRQQYSPPGKFFGVLKFSKEPEKRILARATAQCGEAVVVGKQVTITTLIHQSTPLKTGRYRSSNLNHLSRSEEHTSELQ